jgi:SAM-dependent methyltransferase
VTEGSDYFANHARARKFPWTLYHAPLERDLARWLGEVVAEHPRGDVLVVGCGLLHELDQISAAPSGAAARSGGAGPCDGAPEGVRVTVCDIDARAVDAVMRRGDRRVVRGEVVAPERPIELGRFDAIYAKEVVEHVLAWPEWLAGLRRALVPGGRLWLSTPNYGEPWLPALEATALELIARRSGFSRADLHPTRFSRGALARGLRGLGFDDVRVRATPTRLALTAWARAPR